MAYTNYGFGKAFAYRFPWQWAMQRNDQKEYRNQMLDERRQLRDENNRRWVMEQMKVANPSNEYDTKQYNDWLQNEALPRIRQYVDGNQNYLYDANKMLEFNKLKGELLTHPAVLRSKQLQEQQQAFQDDLNSGRIKEDDPKAIEFYNAYNSYSQNGGEVPVYNRPEEYNHLDRIHEVFSPMQWSGNPEDIQNVTINGTKATVMAPTREAVQARAIDLLSEDPEAWVEAYQAVGQNGLKEGNIIDWMTRLGWDEVQKKLQYTPYQSSGSSSGSGGGKTEDINYWTVNIEQGKLYGTELTPDDDVKYTVPHTMDGNTLIHPRKAPLWVETGEDNYQMVNPPEEYKYQIVSGYNIVPGTDVDDKYGNRFAKIEVAVVNTDKTYVASAAQNILNKMFNASETAPNDETKLDDWFEGINEKYKGMVKVGANSWGMETYSISFIAASPVDRQYAPDYINAKGALSSEKKFAGVPEEQYAAEGDRYGYIPEEAVNKDPNIVLNSFAIQADRVLNEQGIQAFRDSRSSWKTENPTKSSEEFYLTYGGITREWINENWKNFMRQYPDATFQDFTNLIIDKKFKGFLPTNK